MRIAQIAPLYESVPPKLYGGTERVVSYLMDEHQVRHIPITDGGVLCGIINTLDVVKYRLAEIDAEAAAMKEYIAGRI